MINMLSPNDKRELLASRTNSLLLRYIIFFSIFVLLLVLELVAVYFMLNASKLSSEATIRENEQLALSQSSVQKEADQFRSDLATAKIILDRQTPYTSILKTISDLVPNGVVMNSISIDPSTFGTPIDVSLSAKNYEDAIIFRRNLSQSEKFSNVSFKDINYDPKEETPYKYTSIFSVTFKKELLGS